MSVRRLSCPDCGATYRDRWRCRCGAPLSFSDPPVPTGGAPTPTAVDASDGLWRFEDFLAVGDDPADRVTLGEGMTPLVDADGVAGDARADASDADAGPWNAAFKLEYVFPTGSFKDRGATTTLTRARELGVDRVVEDSSGNAGRRSRRTPRGPESRPTSTCQPMSKRPNSARSGERGPSRSASRGAGRT